MRRRPSMFLFAEPWHVRLIGGLFTIMILMVGFNIVKLQRLHRAYAGQGPVYGSHEEKLQRIWDNAHYRYKPPKTKIETRKEQQNLSPEEKETLEDIASVFGITV